MDIYLSKKQIIERFGELSHWMQMSAPKESQDLLVVGEAALTLTGFLDKCRFIDVFVFGDLSIILRRGITIMARGAKVSGSWIHTNTADRLKEYPPLVSWPATFEKIETTLRIGKNVTLRVPHRQTLISLLLFMATRATPVHLENLIAVDPTMKEIDTGLQFVRSIDNSRQRGAELRFVLSKLDFSRETIEGMF